MNYLASALLLFSLQSCSPSAAEMANQEKIETESLNTVAKEDLLRQEEENKQQTQLKQQLNELKAQLAVEENLLRRIEGFKFLRTPDEKANQITTQVQFIEDIKAQIELVEKQIIK